MLNKLYLALGGCLLIGYSVASYSGWELGDEEREFVPAGAHAHGLHSHHAGGYRSFYFWSWSYRGGK